MKISMLEHIYGPQSLYEGLSEVLYYKADHPIEVMASDKIIGSWGYLEADLGTFSGEKMWFVSTSRTLESSFYANPFKNNFVFFELNGSKVAHHHSGTPFDYEGGTVGASADSETEDRIWMTQQDLKPLHRYLTRIILAVGIFPKKDTLMPGREMLVAKQVSAALEYGEAYSIPVLIVPGYIGERRLTRSRLRKSMSPEELSEMLSEFNIDLKSATSLETYRQPPPPFSIQQATTLSSWYDISPTVSIFLHYHYLGWITPDMLEELRGGMLKLSFDGFREPTPDESVNRVDVVISRFRHRPFLRGLREEMARLLSATGLSRLRGAGPTTHAEWLAHFLCRDEGSPETDYIIVEDRPPDWPGVEENFQPAFLSQLEGARKIVAKSKTDKKKGGS